MCFNNLNYDSRGHVPNTNFLKEWCETTFFEDQDHVTSCEIGVREGLGSQVIMLGLKARIQENIGTLV